MKLSPSEINKYITTNYRDFKRIMKFQKFLDSFNNNKCVAFIVRIDPEQTFFPKISSRVREDGGMESNPLHLMTPDLEPELAKKVFKYIDYEKKS